MDDADLVGIMQCFGSLDGPGGSLPKSGWVGGSAAAGPVLFDQSRDARTVDELHRIVAGVGLKVDGEQGNDVRMAQPGSGVGFLLEALKPKRVLERGLRQYLERDALTPRALFGLVNDAHAAAADHAQELEVAKPSRKTLVWTWRRADVQDGGQL